MEPPSVNLFGSLQFYDFEDKVVKQILKAKNSNDDICNQKFPLSKSVMRYDCFCCLSTVTFLLSDMPMLYNRIHIAADKCVRVPTSKFKDLMAQKFKVIDFFNRKKITVELPKLVEFEKEARKNIDRGIPLKFQIGPAKMITLSVSKILCGERYPPFEVLYAPRSPEKSEKSGHLALDPFEIDKSENLPCKKNSICQKIGHRVPKAFTDNVRSCYECKMTFAHNKDEQIQRIRTYSDPFLQS